MVNVFAWENQMVITESFMKIESKEVVNVWANILLVFVYIARMLNILMAIVKVA
jgi:hypothetical protein